MEFTRTSNYGLLIVSLPLLYEPLNNFELEFACALDHQEVISVDEMENMYTIFVVSYYTVVSKR